MRSYKDYIRFWYLNNGFPEPVFKKVIGLCGDIVISATSTRDGFAIQPCLASPASKSWFSKFVNRVKNLVWYCSQKNAAPPGDLRLMKPLELVEDDYRLLFEELKDYVNSSGYLYRSLRLLYAFNVDTCLDLDYLELMAAVKGF